MTADRPSPPGTRPVPCLSFGPDAPARRAALLPDEMPVAIVFNGSTQAVMMATPLDLVDFAYGFALTEGIARPDQIDSIEPVAVAGGIDLRIWLVPEADARLAERRRSMMGPVGCGLCGIDSLDQAMRAPQPVPPDGLRLDPAQIAAAMAALPAGQALHDLTRAVHAAGWWTPDEGLLAVREDVGRHNALDKLAGHLIQAGPRAPGVVLITSRVSIDIVQKVAAIGAGVLVAVSAPTAAAVDLAAQAGITLIARARGERFDLYTHPERVQL